MLRVYTVFLTLAIASGQQSPATMPSWLFPHPGANVVSHTALPDRIEVVYTTDGRPDAVVSHYQRLIVGAGLPFAPSFDGIGTSIRVAAAECDLLINVREQEAGTLTRVSCATKSSINSVSSANTVEVITTKSAGPTNSRRPTMEERRRQGEEETRRVLAEAEAKHKKGVERMKVYDQPVDARARKKQPEQ